MNAPLIPLGQHMAIKAQRDRLLAALREVCFYADFANWCDKTMTDEEWSANQINAQKRADALLAEFSEVQL
jgi:hypothetical protein